MQKAKADIPKTFHRKLYRLRQCLHAHSNLIRIAPSGRPVVARKELQRGSIQDFMRFLYLWHKGQALPSGVKEIVEALHSFGASSCLLSNSNARDVLHGRASV
jgi:hypothetical protein